MIAEICGKISRSGSNLSDRLEDKLTGDFFGVLRYITFDKVMMPILQKVNMLSNTHKLHELLKADETLYWADRIEFWPYHKIGELDVKIELETVIVGIEIKLHSGLSSDDDIDNSVLDEELENVRKASEQQLARESEILREWSMIKQKPAMLILISLEDNCAHIANETFRRNILAENIGFGYISWGEIYELILGLAKTSSFSEFEHVIIQDLIDLLKRKGFERFHSFELPDVEWTNETWTFGSILTESTSDFNFKYNINIEKGEYYEFK